MPTARQVTVFRDIVKERERQEELKAVGKFGYTCADKEMHDAEKIARSF